MELSERRRCEIYRVIHEEIMDTRIRLAKDLLSSKHDRAIAQTVTPIYRRVLKALNAEEGKS